MADYIDLNGIKMKNRYVIASGPAKNGRGYNIYENPLSFFLYRLGIIKPEIFGAVTTKTITLYPHKGNYRWYAPWRVLKKLDDGWVNRFSWSNQGIYHFLNCEYPAIRKKLDNLIVSLGVFEYLEELYWMIELTNAMDILAIELNLSCPHVDIPYRNDRKMLELMITEAAKRSRHPVIVKLGPEKNLGQFMMKVIIAERAGAKALCLINTVPTEIPGFGIGGKSGPGIKKVALELIEKTASVANIPIIGGGGITNRDDCAEFFRRGAQAVFFASVFFSNPTIPQKIVAEN